MINKIIDNKNFTRMFSFIIVFFVICVFSFCIKHQTNNIIKINENATVKINDQEEQIVDLDDFTFDALNKGDTFTITKKLDYDVKTDHPALCFLVYHSVIDCYLDDELVYTYGHDKYDNNITVGSDYYRIPLPDDYINKTLTLKFTVSEDSAFSSIYNVVIQSEKDSYINFITSKILIIMIAIPMFFVGFVCMIISIIRPFRKLNINNLLFIATFSILVSLWIISSNQLLQLITDNITFVALIEYLSLYLAPIPLLFFFYKMQSHKFYKKVLLFMAHYYICFNIIVAIAYKVNWAHYCDFLKLFQLSAAITAIFIAFSTFKGHKNKSQHEKILTYGIIIMIMVCIIDIVRFNLEKYFKINELQLQISLVPFGAFILVITFCYSYGIDLLNNLYKNMERQTLLKMAYRDALTTIPNRAKCERIISDLEDNHEKSITIISLDLNNLKHVNDTYGHQFGDEMICSFSTILSDVFSKKGFVARMGGDEFIVILENVSNDDTEKLLYSLSDSLSKFNKNSSKNYYLSVAYGYATREAKNKKSLWKIYEYADKAMYSNKRIQKEMLAKKIHD